MQNACFGFVVSLACLVNAAYAQTTTASDPAVSDVGYTLQDSEEIGEDAASASADDAEPPTSDGESSTEAVDADSGSLDDASGSIEEGRDAGEIDVATVKGDLRVGYFRTDTDERDSSERSTSEIRGRIRMGGNFNIKDKLIIRGRLASTCSTDECNPELVVDSALPTGSSIELGDITLDQLYIHGYRREKFDVAIGRLQTKFVSRAGVYAKSLDRNDSNNVNVNWTDGVHGVWHVKQDVAGHLILQKNQADGTGSVRRGPIDFNDDDSRITYFLAWESMRRVGPINQRGVDITYMPKSLLKDGGRTGRIKDYIGVVGRFATSWPAGSTGPRLNIAGEIGYAPETPTRAAMGLVGDGDTDGFAWFVTASVLDFRPGHSAGINYGRTDAGWLLSPQFRENDELIEIRYVWRRSRDLAVDVRVRRREELEQVENSGRKRDELDFFARFTLGFGY